MKVLVGAFNQEKALVGAFSVIVQLHRLIVYTALFVAVVAVLALSNGHLTTVVMVAAPARVLAHEQQTASNLMVGLLGLGLISGAVLSAGLVKIL